MTITILYLGTQNQELVMVLNVPSNPWAFSLSVVEWEVRQGGRVSGRRKPATVGNIIYCPCAQIPARKKL